MRPRKERNFASDNNAGICPEAWEAMARANAGHCEAYGGDALTAEVCDRFRDLFETPCEVFFVFNGTAANALALAHLCRPYHSAICHELAHIETDECGAPEFFSGGAKILTVPGPGGKVAPAEVERVALGRNDLHYPKPKALSVSQSTEISTVYTPDELRQLGAITHGLGLFFHMDGARFANALASLGCAPKDLTWKAGVDALCLGGAKNGMALGEAAVFFNQELAEDFEYRCKQAGQLCSKMRYLSAPWLGMLENGAWLKHARHANACAARLAEELRSMGLEILYPVESNALFVAMSDALKAGLRERGWRFYDFIAAGGARLVCSWDTRDADIAAFVADARELLDAHGR